MASKKDKKRGKKPAVEPQVEPQVERTALDDVADLERRFAEARRQALKHLRRRGRAKAIPEELREEVERKFADGEMLTSVQAWLKREHGIEVSIGTLHAMRAQFLGRRFPKEALAEIDRIEGAVDPLRRLAELLERIEARYRAHVETERAIGLQLDEPAVKYLKLMGKTNMMILEALERLGVITPKRTVEMKHTVADGEFDNLDPDHLRRLLRKTILTVMADQHGDPGGGAGSS